MQFRAVVGLLLVLGVAGCTPNTGQTTTAPAPSGDSGAPLVGQAALEVYPDGFASAGTALRNGAGVRLAPNLRVEVFVDPYPATGSNVWLDLFVSNNGRAVDSAIVTSDNTMAYMNHGTSHQEGNNSGDGHYLFALNYPMVGPWQHLIHFRVEDATYDLALVVTVYPA